MRRLSGVQIVVLTLCGLLLLFCVSQFAFPGSIVPVRVIGASMAERFHGPHYRVCCQACQFCFAVDATVAEIPRFVGCPNCGSQQPHNPDELVFPGDRLFINRMSYTFRDPERWETILFRSADPPLDQCLKRVVGLPEETVAVAHGDVWIDGKRLKKDWSTVDALAITVHDARFASNQPLARVRWRPSHQATPWNKIPHTVCSFRCTPKSETAHQSAPIEWIVYDHVDFHRGRVQATHQVTDNYAYNQTLSRKLYNTDDLIVGAKAQWFGVGRLFFQLGSLCLELDCGQGSGKLWDGGLELAEFPWPAEQRVSPVWMEVASVDQQFFFVINKKVVFSCDLEEKRIAAARHPQGDPLGESEPRSGSILAIGSQSLDVVIEDLLVRRDIYYTPEVHGVANRRTDEYRLAADEFFVLGDNSPVSLDSRQDTVEAIVRRKDLLGRVWRWR